MSKIVDSVGLDADGIINDLDFYQYMEGVPHFLKKYSEKNKIKLDNEEKLLNPEFYINNYEHREEIIEFVTEELNKQGIDIKET